jgi:hypothetical protein
MAFSFPFGLPIPFCLSIPKTLWKLDRKVYIQEGQVISSSSATKAIINIEKAKDEALDFTTSFGVEDMKCLHA